MSDTKLYNDLYLYTIPENDKLVKIPHLSRDDAEKYARYWLEMNELHDYMLVLEGSTPWSEPEPDISVKSPDWIFEQNKKINYLEG